MDVLSACQLPVASLLWQTPARGSSLAVVCKATYLLAPIESQLADTQEPPCDKDVYRRDDPGGSLRLASDLVPFKRRAEVLLVGHAHAPRREPVRSLRARLLVGEVDKTIEVFADRAFTLEGQLREGPRFTRMPLLWKRAAGGPGTSNPSGVRLDAPPDAFGQRPLPNLQPPGLHITSPDDVILPVGFGPLAPTWPGRWEKLGRHATGWDPQRWAERPLPDDIDPGYFNAALPDQQVEAIRPNERIILENLHAEHERLVTSLAPATPRARIEWAQGGAEDVRFRCDTIWIDTDQGTCALTWRAQIPIDQPERQGRVTVTLAQGGKGGDERRRWNGLGTTAAGSAPSSPAPSSSLPFGRPASEAPPAMPARVDRPREVAAPARLDRPAEQSPPPRLDRPVEMPSRGRVDVTQDAPIQGAMPVLPFRVGRSPLSGSVLGQRPAEPSFKTEAPWQGSTDLPFVPPASPSSPPPPTPSADRLAGLPFAAPAPTPQLDFDEDTSDEITQDHLPWLRSEETPFRSPAVLTPVMEAAPPIVAPLPIAAPPIVAPPPPIAAPAVAPAPPPMLGPLATPEMLAAPPPAPGPAPEIEPEATVDLPAPAPEAAPQVELPLARYPLERCARIAASIARRKAETAAILDEHELAPAMWGALEKHWAEAIAAEMARGKPRLLKAYDAAYVGRVEEERGLVEVGDYARLTVATERGTVGEVIAALGLPKGAVLRIQRVWLGKITADPVLAAQVRAAIEQEREA
jgi:hypothetical protein